MCQKVKREKFPLAAARVVVEFKLRRAKGCKISKLWLKKKMKEKVEACYGKEPGIVNRTFEIRTQSNSIEFNLWIEFD